MFFRNAVLLTFAVTLSGCLLNTDRDGGGEEPTKEVTVGAVLLRDIQGDEKTAYVYAEFAKSGSRANAKNRVITQAALKASRADTQVCKTSTMRNSRGRDLFPSESRIDAGEMYYGPAANQQLLAKVASQNNIYLQYLPSNFASELKQVKTLGSDVMKAFSAAFSVPTPLEDVRVNGIEITEELKIDRREPLLIDWKSPFLVNEDSVIGIFLTASDNFGTKRMKCLMLEKDIAAGTATVTEWKIDPKQFESLPVDEKATLRVLRGHLVMLQSSDQTLKFEVEATRSWERTVALEF